MQRVTNCVLVDGDEVLLLQKPRRGWWVAPGGKMEAGETIKEAAVREFREETGLHVEGAELKAVCSMVIIEQDEIISEWMMFTFSASNHHGQLLKQSPEGILNWTEKDDIKQLPMAEGDHYVMEHVLNGEGVLYATFHYTPEFKLLSYRLDPSQ
ncbi:8-oxo-dGTP diphosphatase [Alkalihalobacillus pseudalcaliphilus]|uniref:8-oxo-dGTP diphosphatase n=1 Tax=Alkalihalobacillus pseudalcaliphilus TaxID=79884 RepID=UPI00064D781D|nr:8-oxo-dGTP diphosphatase [Alkalihalobacillus pseudalcaliphilus]KMK77853.1 NUDIX hydrolase [Alkalihalobacillus pseudalcaliphilus]